MAVGVTQSGFAGAQKVAQNAVCIGAAPLKPV
jgi:hypothetical protein